MGASKELGKRSLSTARRCARQVIYIENIIEKPSYTEPRKYNMFSANATKETCYRLEVTDAI